MKTLQELYQELLTDEKLKEDFLEAVQQGEMETLEFVNSNGCNVTLEEMKAFANGFESSSDEELSEDDLQNVAGGASKVLKTVGMVALSVFTPGALGCIGYAVASACIDTDAPKDDFQKQSDYRDKNAPKETVC